jgi:hypothetical protein
MLGNQMARLKIWQGLENPFDYNGFCVKCREVDIIPMCLLEYSHKVGMLLVARAQFPGLTDDRAYTLIVSKTALLPEDQSRVDAMIERMNQEMADQKGRDAMAQAGIISRCGGCGGGRVR